MTRQARTARLITMAGSVAVLVVVGERPAVADVPGSGIVQDAVGGATGWAVDEITGGIARWVLGSVAFFVEGALGFLLDSARPAVDASWFAGAGSPFATVRNLAAVLMVAFAFLAVLQGLVQGDPALMVRQILAKLPLAVVGVVVTVQVVVVLLDLTDALSAAVLDNSSGRVVAFLSGFGAAATGATSGFAAVVLGLVAVVASLILWIELIVRASLVYLLVAISPLGFAAMVWPAARGFLRKTLELLAAVIVSKFVIAVALSVGVAALAGAGGPSGGAGGEAAQPGVAVDGALGALLTGTVVLGLAAFAPFVVLKLVPLAEAAVAANGVSRMPVRAVQGGASTYSSVTRLAGGRQGGASAGTPPGASTPTAAANAGGTAGGAGPAGASGSPAGTAGAAGRAAAGAGVAAGLATAGIAGVAVGANATATGVKRTADGLPARADEPGRRPAPVPPDQLGGRP